MGLEGVFVPVELIEDKLVVLRLGQQNVEPQAARFVRQHVRAMLAEARQECVAR